MNAMWFHAFQLESILSNLCCTLLYNLYWHRFFQHYVFYGNIQIL